MVFEIQLLLKESEILKIKKEKVKFLSKETLHLKMKVLNIIN